ncbi:hypothetical protein C8K44_10177 [Aminobacter sp. AP02]|nr:hypothetical protein C8K44_10177 [Aminobacter sp. AP02]
MAALTAIGAVALAVMANGNHHTPLKPNFEADRSGTIPWASPNKPHAAPEDLAVIGPARAIAPEVVVPPEAATQTLERIEARPPLGNLGLAPPPKPMAPDDWEGTLLYRPSVKSSASFEAMGYKVLIAGTEAIGLHHSCEFEGIMWRCGERAMLAFRYWLRGRAPLCQVFPPADRQPVAAVCRLGKQDIGAWLVSNGWAHAKPGGGYERAEEVARKAKMGVFGPPG